MVAGAQACHDDQRYQTTGNAVVPTIKPQVDEFKLTRAEVIARLGISTSGLYRLRQLPYRQYKRGGRRYYRLIDIEALLESSIHQPEQESTE